MYQYFTNETFKVTLNKPNIRNELLNVEIFHKICILKASKENFNQKSKLESFNIRWFVKPIFNYI